MSFLCPRCRARLSSEGAAHATCQGCSLVVDLAQADTGDGLGSNVPALRDLSGTTLGAYRLEALLGAGGMGTVYRAAPMAGGDAVAVKVLYPQLATQPEVRARFWREADALAALTHPNIVRFRERGEDGGQCFLVMDYVAGESLEAKLASGPLAPVEIAELAIEVCDALAFAHAHGVVHRDLKPANIIIGPQGVRVVDFGIAHVAFGEMTLTHTEALLGTLSYMAPEQRDSADSIDGRADLFALGVVLYRLLAGVLPVGSFEPPSGMRKGVEARWDALVHALLQRDRDKRPTNAKAVIARLTPLTKAGRRRRRRRMLALATLSWLGLVAMLGVDLLSRSDPCAPQSSLPVPPAPDAAMAPAPAPRQEPARIETPALLPPGDVAAGDVVSPKKKHVPLDQPKDKPGGKKKKVKPESKFGPAPK